MLALKRSTHEVARRLAPLLARGVASWSKFNPSAMSGTNPAQVSNLGEQCGSGGSAGGRQLRRSRLTAFEALARPSMHITAALIACHLSACSVWRVGAD